VLFFERALALDPGNIEAMAGTAFVDARIASDFITDERATRFASAEAMLTKVLSSAPDHAFAHMWLGYVQMHTNRAARGIAEHERAVALDRNLATAYGLIGFAKLTIGRGEETEAHVQEALRLSPRDTEASDWMNIARAAKLYLGADEEAVPWLHRAIETNRNWHLPHFFLGASLAHLGRIDEARAETQARLGLNPAFTLRRFRAGASSDNPSFLRQRQRVIDGMRKAGVPEG
jgi:tetratricopeptide (TPR) repeat protein